MTARMLYETDFYTWTQEQSERLRATRDNALDAEHLSEEVADLGKSELNKTTEHLTQVLIHLIKLACSPSDSPRGGWRGEVLDHQRQAAKAFSPGMRRKIDVADLWHDALIAANAGLRDHGEAEVPSSAKPPFDLDELLNYPLNVDGAVDRVREALR